MGGILIAGVGAGAQLVQVAAFLEQVDELQDGALVADGGPGAQLVQVAVLGQ